MSILLVGCSTKRNVTIFDSNNNPVENALLIIYEQNILTTNKMLISKTNAKGKTNIKGFGLCNYYALKNDKSGHIVSNNSDIVIKISRDNNNNNDSFYINAIQNKKKSIYDIIDNPFWQEYIDIVNEKSSREIKAHLKYLE